MRGGRKEGENGRRGGGGGGGGGYDLFICLGWIGWVGVGWVDELGLVMFRILNLIWVLDVVVVLIWVLICSG